MTYIMVDVEADGPIPGDYSMVCFGAIVVEPSLDRTFYGRLKPISDKWIPEALQVSGFTREETLEFDEPAAVMQQFADWIAVVGSGQPMFISDNNGFDWQFINWYFHHFLGEEPVRPQFDQSRLALQGRGPGHVRQLQASAEDRAHAQSGGRCSGQRRSAVADQGAVRPEDQLQVTGLLHHCQRGAEE